MNYSGSERQGSKFHSLCSVASSFPLLPLPYSLDYSQACAPPYAAALPSPPSITEPSELCLKPLTYKQDLLCGNILLVIRGWGNSSGTVGILGIWIF